METREEMAMPRRGEIKGDLKKKENRFPRNFLLENEDNKFKNKDLHH